MIFDGESCCFAWLSDGFGTLRASRGCVIRMWGSKELWQQLTIMEVRHFVEHAVAVEYCDLQAEQAHLRLRCPEDCSRLVEELKLTQRLLGWEQPSLEVLDAEQEAPLGFQTRTTS